MNNPQPLSGNDLYALRLRSDGPLRIAGQLEHVLSGRRHQFSDAASLLAFLALELSMQPPAPPPPRQPA